MRLTLHQLYVFQQVAEHKSVSIAAQYLHMTQPAVSNVLKQLRDYFDCPLIQVIGRKLFLTEFGELLMSSSHTIDSVLENTKTEIELLKGAMVGTLKVAIVSTAKYFMPQLLSKFKVDNPRVHIKLTVCNRNEILQRLENNLDDFVIMSHPPTTISIVSGHVYEDELVVISGSEFSKRLQGKKRLDDLKEVDWLIREEGSGTRYATEKILKQHTITLNVEMELGDSEAIKQAVQANMGVSIASKRSVESELAHGQIKLIQVEELPVQHPWFLVSIKKKVFSPIARKFINFINVTINYTQETPRCRLSIPKKPAS